MFPFLVCPELYSDRRFDITWWRPITGLMTFWSMNRTVPGMERAFGKTGMGGGRGSSYGTADGSSRSK